MLSMEVKFTGFMHVVLKVMKIFKTLKGISSVNIQQQMLYSFNCYKTRR